MKNKPMVLGLLKVWEVFPKGLDEASQNIN
jgi:hypothetical protein